MRDWLFRIGIYRGIRIDPPAQLFCPGGMMDGQLIQRREIHLNYHHDMAQWLLHDCEGPWKMKVHWTRKKLTTYLRFARVEDAMAFRLMLT